MLREETEVGVYECWMAVVLPELGGAGHAAE